MLHLWNGVLCALCWGDIAHFSSPARCVKNVVTVNVCIAFPTFLVAVGGFDEFCRAHAAVSSADVAEQLQWQQRHAYVTPTDLGVFLVS